MDPSTKPIFSFVNLQHPDDLKDERFQHRVRRLAMTEVGKARRKTRSEQGRKEIPWKLRKPSRNTIAIHRLGGGQLDLFSAYPINVDDSARALLAHSTLCLSMAVLLSNTNSLQLKHQPPRSITGSWYPVAFSSASAFHTVLANSQNFMFQKIHGYFPSQNDDVSLAHRHRPLVLPTMEDPAKRPSNEFIGAVINFMSHLVDNRSI